MGQPKKIMFGGLGLVLSLMELKGVMLSCILPLNRKLQERFAEHFECRQYFTITSYAGICE
jgi:hypothetical protein